VFHVERCDFSLFEWVWGCSTWNVRVLVCWFVDHVVVHEMCPATFTFFAPGMVQWAGFIGRAFSPLSSIGFERGASPHAGIGRTVGALSQRALGTVFVLWAWAGAVAPWRDAHPSDDEAVARMGHPAGFVPMLV
jgi:hypothetical protein